MFGAFSPVENAEIAVAIVSQNDSVGGGGRAAAPIAGKIIKKYWELKKASSKRKKRANCYNEKGKSQCSYSKRASRGIFPVAHSSLDKHTSPLLKSSIIDYGLITLYGFCELV